MNIPDFFFIISKNKLMTFAVLFAMISLIYKITYKESVIIQSFGQLFFHSYDKQTGTILLYDIHSKKIPVQLYNIVIPLYKNDESCESFASEVVDNIISIMLGSAENIKITNTRKQQNGKIYAYIVADQKDLGQHLASKNLAITLKKDKIEDKIWCLSIQR